MILSNCHTHTVFCDGKNTAEEMVQAAIDRGFYSLGFSVHSPMKIENTWACTEADFPEFINEISRLKEKYREAIEIYNGIELDSDHIELSLGQFDYIIGAVHQLHVGGNIYSIDDTKEILQGAIDKEFDGDPIAMAKHYYSEYTEYLINLKPDVAAHFDLIEKFNNNNALFDSDSPAYKLMVKLYLEKICFECPDMIFEVNTGAMFRVGNRLPYPAPFIMKFLKSHNMRITISSDSHCTESLDYKFPEMIDYCKSFGFDSVHVLKDGQFTPVSI